MLKQILHFTLGFIEYSIKVKQREVNLGLKSNILKKKTVLYHPSKTSPHRNLTKDNGPEDTVKGPQ